MLLFFIRKLKVFDVKNSYSNKNYLKPLFPRSLQKCQKKKRTAGYPLQPDFAIVLLLALLGYKMFIF